MKKATAIILLIVSGLLLTCKSPFKKDFLKDAEIRGGSHFMIWALSDIQPRENSQKKYYELAIDDINKNFSNITVAVVAGDIIQNTEPKGIFPWYVSMKKKTAIKYWYEIAGNHDNKDYGNYFKYIKKPPHYSVEIGNMLILLLSDENQKPPTVISDKAFQWWKKMVIQNQDKIIITVTHGYLKQSNLFGSFVDSRNIENSERFARVLKKYKVDIWICGHTHLPHYIKGHMTLIRELNNTLFINVSAIRADPFMAVESSFFIFRKDSDYALVRSRKHEAQKFVKSRDYFHRLSHKFQWDGMNPVMKPFKK